MSNPEGRPLTGPEIVGPNAAFNEEGDIVPIDDVPELMKEELLPQEIPSAKEILAADVQLGLEMQQQAHEVSAVDAHQDYWDLYDSLTDNYPTNDAKIRAAKSLAASRGVEIAPEHLQQHPLAS